MPAGPVFFASSNSPPDRVRDSLLRSSYCSLQIREINNWPSHDFAASCSCPIPEISLMELIAIRSRLSPVQGRNRKLSLKPESHMYSRANPGQILGVLT